MFSKSKNKANTAANNNASKYVSNHGLKWLYAQKMCVHGTRAQKSPV
jgi:hypothetical protein